MTNYARGRAAEYRAQRILEAAGYQTIRAAGSRGVWDLIGWNAHSLVYVQVKRGAGNVAPAEREQIQLAVVPKNAAKVIMRFRKPRQQPEIEHV